MFELKNYPTWLKWLLGILGPTIVLGIATWIMTTLWTPFKTMRDIRNENLITRIERLENLPDPDKMDEYIQTLLELKSWQNEEFDKEYLKTIEKNTEAIIIIKTEDIGELKETIEKIDDIVRNNNSQLGTLSGQMEILINRR